MESEQLKRVITLPSFVANIINSVIGAGIFVLPALVAEKLGSSSVYAYLYCGILISLIMLCFAELGSKTAVSGGLYTYIERAFGPMAGFLATNMFVFGVTILASAAISNALLDAMATFFPILSLYKVRVVVLFVMYSTLTWVNIRGVQHGIGLVVAITILKLIPLLLIIVVGILSLDGKALAGEIPSFENLGSVSLLLFFAFQGAENGLTVGGEIKNPQKSIPIGIFISFFVILMMYMALQVITQSVLGESIVAYKSAPLVETGTRLMGTFGATFLFLGTIFSMFGYLSGDILNLPRVLFASSVTRTIPIDALARVHPKFKTPHVAIIVYCSLCFLFAIVAGFQQLAVLSSASILMLYFGVALSVLKLRKENLPGFKIPGKFLVPVACCLAILWLLVHLEQHQLIALSIFIVLLLAAYLFTVYYKRKFRNQKVN